MSTCYVNNNLDQDAPTDVVKYVEHGWNFTVETSFHEDHLSTYCVDYNF